MDIMITADGTALNIDTGFTQDEVFGSLFDTAGFCELANFAEYLRNLIRSKNIIYDMNYDSNNLEITIYMYNGNGIYEKRNYNFCFIGIKEDISKLNDVLRQLIDEYEEVSVETCKIIEDNLRKNKTEVSTEMTKDIDQRKELTQQDKDIEALANALITYSKTGMIKLKRSQNIESLFGLLKVKRDDFINFLRNNKKVSMSKETYELHLFNGIKFIFFSGLFAFFSITIPILIRFSNNIYAIPPYVIPLIGGLASITLVKMIKTLLPDKKITNLEIDECNQLLDSFTEALQNQYDLCKVRKNIPEKSEIERLLEEIKELLQYFDEKSQEVIKTKVNVLLKDYQDKTKHFRNAEDTQQNFLDPFTSSNLEVDRTILIIKLESIIKDLKNYNPDDLKKWIAVFYESREKCKDESFKPSENPTTIEEKIEFINYFEVRYCLGKLESKLFKLITKTKMDCLRYFSLDDKFNLDSPITEFITTLDNLFDEAKNIMEIKDSLDCKNDSPIARAVTGLRTVIDSLDIVNKRKYENFLNTVIHSWKDYHQDKNTTEREILQKLNDIAENLSGICERSSKNKKIIDSLVVCQSHLNGELIEDDSPNIFIDLINEIIALDTQASDLLIPSVLENLKNTIDNWLRDMLNGNYMTRISRENEEDSKKPIPNNWQNLSEVMYLQLLIGRDLTVIKSDLEEKIKKCQLAKSYQSEINSIPQL